MTDLKPCPFCGGPADYNNDVGSDDDYLEEWYSCLKCGARCHNAKDWNTRVSPWRSLKDDPPKQKCLAILRGKRDADPYSDDDFRDGYVYKNRFLSPVPDSECTPTETWFSWGYDQWMEVPE